MIISLLWLFFDRSALLARLHSKKHAGEILSGLLDHYTIGNEVFLSHERPTLPLKMSPTSRPKKTIMWNYCVVSEMIWTFSHQSF